MNGIQIRRLPAYDGDPGDGIRIEAKPQIVEIGISYEGAERQVVHIDPETLIDIAREAMDWHETVYLPAPLTRIVQHGITEV